MADNKLNNTDSEVMSKIIDAIKSINFGTVTIFVRDGQVTQLECTEKTRLK